MDERASGRNRTGRIAAAMLMVGLLSSVSWAAERIVTIGDSWAYLVASYGSVQLMLDTFFSGQGYTVANESFGGGTAANHAALLDQITTKINAHPTADVVWLSSGGNDIMLGQAAGGWYLGMANEQALFNTVGANVQTVVNHILSLRSDLQIVIIGYDYPNVWDFDTKNGGTGQVIRANLGLGLSGSGWITQPPYPPTFEIAQQQAVNAAIRAVEDRKTTIAANSRRVHYVNDLGVNNYVVGYGSFFGTWPAGNWYNDLPMTKSRLGASGTDGIHLNTDGYNLIALQAYNNFFASAFQPAVLSLSSTTLNFGNVRVGTSASGSVTATNTGPNFTKIKSLAFAAASGEFSGATQSFSPLFKDPTLGSDSAQASYSYTPTGRGQDSTSLSVTSNSGSASLLLTGKGVGPVFSSSASSLGFGQVTSGGSLSLPLSITNATDDAELGSLTQLTLASAEITGTDAGAFSLSGFTAGTILNKGQQANLTVQFSASGAPGARSATLVFHTDQGAGAGGAGQTFNIGLSAQVTQAYALSLTVINESYGTVTVEPNLPEYPSGSVVTLSATPIDGKSFRQWEIYDPNYPGDANYAVIDTNNPLTIVMTGDTSVGAAFKCGTGASLGLPVLGLLALWMFARRVR